MIEWEEKLFEELLMVLVQHGGNNQTILNGTKAENRIFLTFASAQRY